MAFFSRSLTKTKNMDSSLNTDDANRDRKRSHANNNEITFKTTAEQQFLYSSGFPIIENDGRGAKKADVNANRVDNIHSRGSVESSGNTASLLVQQGIVAQNIHPWEGNQQKQQPAPPNPFDVDKSRGGIRIDSHSEEVIVDKGNNSLNNNMDDICSRIPLLLRHHIHEYIHSEGGIPREHTLAYRQACEIQQSRIQQLAQQQQSQQYTDTLLIFWMKQEIRESLSGNSIVSSFLRCCNYDLYAAAHRLCLYWTERVKIFGSDRAFVPFHVLDTQGGVTPPRTVPIGIPTSTVKLPNGLNPELDIPNLLCPGCLPVTILPKNRIGQKFLFLDLRKQWNASSPNSSTSIFTNHNAGKPFMDEATLFRCLFYQFQTLLEDNGNVVAEGLLATSNIIGNNGSGDSTAITQSDDSIVCLVAMGPECHYNFHHPHGNGLSSWPSHPSTVLPPSNDRTTTPCSSWSGLWRRIFFLLAQVFPVKLKIHLLLITSNQRNGNNLLATDELRSRAQENIFCDLFPTSSDSMVSYDLHVFSKDDVMISWMMLEHERFKTAGAGREQCSIYNNLCHDGHKNSFQELMKRLQFTDNKDNSSRRYIPIAPLILGGGGSTFSSGGDEVQMEQHNDYNSQLQFFLNRWLQDRVRIEEARYQYCFNLFMNSNSFKHIVRLSNTEGDRNDAAVIAADNYALPASNHRYVQAQQQQPSFLRRTNISNECFSGTFPVASCTQLLSPGIFDGTRTTQDQRIFIAAKMAASSKGHDFLQVPSTAAGEATGFSLNPATNAKSLALSSLSAGESSYIDDVCSRFPDAMRAQVLDYIRISMNKTDTKSFWTALSIDANLVYKETDPLQFIRCCDYDVGKGAERLCLYWTERESLFGSDRAFLPMVLTGTGALKNEDINLIHAGYPALLPETTTTGQQCILLDKRYWIPGTTPESVARACFFVFKIAAQNPISQTKGVLLFNVKVCPHEKDVDWKCLRRVTAIAATIFPAKLTFHLLCIPHRKRRVDAASIMNELAHALRKLFKTDAYIHLQMQPESAPIRTALSDLGLSKKAIPFFFGGEWKVEDWFNWCQLRSAEERCANAHQFLIKNDVAGAMDESLSSKTSSFDRSLNNCSVRGSNTFYEVNKKRRTTTVFKRKDDVIDETATKTTVVAVGDEEANAGGEETQRKLQDMLRSRRKRERQRVQIQALQDESKELLQKNEQLQEEHRALKQLLYQANIAAKSCTPLSKDISFI